MWLSSFNPLMSDCSFFYCFCRSKRNDQMTKGQHILTKHILSIVRVVWMCVNGVLVWTWVTDYSVCLCECVRVWTVWDLQQTQKHIFYPFSMNLSAAWDLPFRFKALSSTARKRWKKKVSLRELSVMSHRAHKRHVVELWKEDETRAWASLQRQEIWSAPAYTPYKRQKYMNGRASMGDLGCWKTYCTHIRYSTRPSFHGLLSATSRDTLSKRKLCV